MTLIANSHRAESRGLTFDLGEGIDFTTRRTCFVLRGDNGVGKTSFLEKVLVPALTADKVPFLYLAQDLSAQMLTLKALVALRGHKTARGDDVATIAAWIAGSRNARVFILDEFDKYAPGSHFIYNRSAGFINTYIVVSHLASERTPPLPVGFKVCQIDFATTAVVDTARQIAVSKAAL
jgi:hypothetical protein